MATRRRTIAVIDDDREVRKALQRLLTVSGYHPLLFASAAEFLHSPARSSADCLLIDIQLGSGSGLELASHAIVTAPKPPAIVFMSAAVDDAVRRQALELGMAYLQKPFDAAGLCAALSAAGIWPL
jgi:FixJ family two-component response regulator